MIGIYNTITIDGTEYPRPNDFTLEREDIYAGEYETCTGAIKADRVGWRYAEKEIVFDMLTDSQMSTLSTFTTGDITFTESDGTHTETAARVGFSNTPTRLTTSGGAVIWKNVALKVRFIDAHN